VTGMRRSPRPLPPPRRLGLGRPRAPRPRALLASLLAGALPLSLGGLALAQSAPGQARATHVRTARAHGARAKARPHAKAHAAGSYLTGIGDEQPEMFSNPLWLALHTKIARYIAPYDAAYHLQDLTRAREWISRAEAMHQQILVAFYHSERTPTRIPSVAQYTRDVRRFLKLFPKVRQYQSWNEANRGNVRHMFSSPSASQAAQYYRALKRACTTCTVIGLDILDQPNIAPTLRYIEEFKQEIGRMRTVMPSVWGLHNYSDTNRFSSVRTRAILAVVPGQVWLTETGGVVHFGGAFPNSHGSGLVRAAKALSYMFNLAAANGSRIKRLYIFQWSGSTLAARFDAGLMDPRYRPRRGYVVVCKHMRAEHCSNVRISSH
jgi:hypothetical protein